jgi:serine/threonine protein kinase
LQRLFKKGQLSEDHLRKRFDREVRYQSKISHPNVVSIYKHDTAYIPPYFVMELGVQSLADELTADITLGGQPQKALFDIIGAAGHAHESRACRWKEVKIRIKRLHGRAAQLPEKMLAL